MCDLGAGNAWRGGRGRDRAFDSLVCVLVDVSSGAPGLVYIGWIYCIGVYWVGEGRRGEERREEGVWAARREEGDGLDWGWTGMGVMDRGEGDGTGDGRGWE